MIWRHIDFWFYPGCSNDADRYLNPDQQHRFELFVANILTALKPLIRRSFYLYEPQPHTFLAIETRRIYLPIIKIALFFFRLSRPLFIEGVYLKSQHIPKLENDGGNGEGFLNVMSAMNNYYLFKKDCKLTHLVHCLLEFQMQSRDKEIEFYKKMLELYTPKKKRMR